MHTLESTSALPKSIVVSAPRQRASCASAFFLAHSTFFVCLRRYLRRVAIQSFHSTRNAVHSTPVSRSG